MASEPEQYTYPGGAIDVVWDGRLCIHVGECTRARGALFEIGRQPWCEPDSAEVDVVAAVVERCPSGALSYSRPDGTEFEAIPASNSIVVANNGPLYARGDLAIEGAPENAPGLRTRAALCRCGRSANKPFCDNSHEAAEFRDRGPIGDVGEQLAAQGGPLSIRALANGPLLVEGNLTLTSGHGLPTWSGTRVALCRCGESANKPFCDGTHALVGFKSDEDAASGATG
jgi:CDGSH-type Zn-finger protein/uncharacterized Fe-S cluster protein YjdI